jgi:hypothetical protein
MYNFDKSDTGDMSNPKALVAVFVLVVSCTAEPPLPFDPRDELVGKYRYLPVYYFENLEPNEFHNRLQDLDYTFEFEKTDDLSTFDLVFESGVAVRCFELAKATNGYTFKVEDQTTTLNGQSILLTGVAEVEVNGVKHHGEIINFPEKRIHFFLKYETSTEASVLEVDAKRSQ